MRPFPLMLFAAGLGTRMRPLTDHRPKPLIPVAGKALIDHALAVADGAGAHPVAVNLHYLGGQIETHLQGRAVIFCDETDRLLDTGGGLKAALPRLAAPAVMTLNTDAVWTGENPLAQLAAGWDPARMDALLLLLPVDQALGHGGKSDFLIDDQGRIRRANGQTGYVYLGAQIIASGVVSAVTEPVFGMMQVWQALIAQGRAFGVVHRGGWCDVGHPGGIAVAEALLADV